MSEEDISLVGGAEWVAARLGKSRTWFTQMRPHLEKQGFPRKDAVVGGWLKRDVDAWLERRRQVCDKVEAHHKSSSEIRINEL